ncbi:hypothetical protein NQD34_004771 [Periophthalmus magnuspinnatus]|nr:hypothetical protein NQD34_004771 [Periophthalmus magnuspinnatus]
MSIFLWIQGWSTGYKLETTCAFTFTKNRTRGGCSSTFPPRRPLPTGRCSRKEDDNNNQMLKGTIFSRFSFVLSPRIVAYVEEIDSAKERRGGATQRSLNPGKEGTEQRRGRSPCHVARAWRSVSGAALRRKRRRQ